MQWQEWQQMAEEETRATLESLPSPLREQAARLTVSFERFPNRKLREDGIEPDVLGLFVGPSYEDEAHALLPAQIFLYLENIWESAGQARDRFRREIRKTLLHELGHYLGLDEAGLDERGLE